MKLTTDQKYLKEQQYKTPSNLEARINLHRLFSTNPYGWFRWQLDQMDLQPGMRVLEVGCGPGRLWSENRHRLPMPFQAVLSDLSTGMVVQARAGLEGLADFTYLAFDAQAIPAPTAAFDIAVANHMLYHVPDMRMALKELRRVLRPGGLLCAATNGEHDMHQLSDLIHAFHPHGSREIGFSLGFNLENGPALVGEFFPQVEVRHYLDSLEVTDVEPLLDYLRSMWETLPVMQEGQARNFEAFVRRRFAESGGKFLISKTQGMVIARAP